MSPFLEGRFEQLARDDDAGVGFGRLIQRLARNGRSVRHRGAADPLRQTVETSSPLLRGGPSGSGIATQGVERALAGRQGDDDLSGGAQCPRGAEIYRLVA